jgi:sugar phosphate isomerase/epimerase
MDHNGMDRRTWLRIAGGGIMAHAANASLRAQAARPLGVQLYTVRDRLGARTDQTLAAIAAIGYRELEVLRADLPQVVPLARKHGLRAVSMHLEAPFVTGDWTPWRDALKVPEGSTLERALGDAATHGVQYAVLSYLMPAERGGGLTFYQRLSDQLNTAGEAGRKAGVTIGYLNHGFEFEPLPDGRRPIDVLVERTDPALVTLELDVFWAGITGADPVALLGKYKGRVALVHLKDRAKDAPTATDERKVAPSAFKEVGSGSLDFAAILKAADAAGVAHYFVEQDHTPGDPVASLRQSFRYLQTLI